MDTPSGRLRGKHNDVDQSSITLVADSAADTHDVSEVRPLVARLLSRFARRLARFHE